MLASSQLDLGSKPPSPSEGLAKSRSCRSRTCQPGFVDPALGAARQPAVPHAGVEPANGLFQNNGKGACGDYAAAQSVDPVLATQRLIAAPADYRGVLELNRMTRITEITDGSSNTILLTEDAGRPRLWRAGRTRHACRRGKCLGQ